MPEPDSQSGGVPASRSLLRRGFSRGLGISLPILITLVVFLFVLNFLTGLLEPGVILIQETVGYTERLPDIAIAALALGLLLVLILFVGLAAEYGYDSGIERYVENTIADLPGIGSIYSGVDDLSNTLLDSDAESFREVKVIEYPFEGTYALAFKTAGSTGVVGEATGEDEMITVFLPMAPNPMGGFLIHVPKDRVYDVDLTVEEGVQTILSTGVALEAKYVERVADSEQTGVKGGTEGSKDPSDGQPMD